MHSRTMAAILTATFLLTGAFHASADRFLEGLEENRRWSPIVDEVYLQEHEKRIETSAPVTSVEVFEGTLYAVIDGAVHELVGDNLYPITEAPSGMRSLQALDGALWGITDNGLYRFDGFDLELVDEREFVDLTLHRGQVHAATRMAVYRYDNGELRDIKPEEGYRSHTRVFELDDGVQRLPEPLEFGPSEHIASHAGAIYGLRGNNLFLFDGFIIEPNTADWGILRTNTTRDMVSLGNRLYIATDRGLARLRGYTMQTLTGKDGLPYEDITCLAEGFDNDLWIGTKQGAIRKVGEGDYHYFAAQRWLPDNHVNAIAAGDDTVYVATNGGLGVIEYVPYTLRKKADLMENYLEEWGHLRMGFVHRVRWSDEHGEWIREVSDNDGGRAAHHLASMTYKYAVTGDESAREMAVDAFKAMIWLEEITPMEGFPARAIYTVGSNERRGMTGSGGWPAQWHPTDDGNWEWKGDTSSDETGAHYYAISLFHDLAARGQEKERAAEHIRRMTDHIIDNGWLLRDYDGTPTRWGRWDPDYLHNPYGQYAQGLNGLEAQTKAITALALTGEQRFQEGLEQLMEWRYHEETVRQKLTFPPNYNTRWDDRLAFLSLFPALKYIEDPRLETIYRLSLERSWEIKRIEQFGWFNIVYGIITGNEFEAEATAAHLREWPIDPRAYDFDNSIRADMWTTELAPFEVNGYVQYAGTYTEPAPRAPSMRNQEPLRLSRSTIALDGGSGGNRVARPSVWLETYWKGRYYGLITEPQTDDPDLISKEPSGERPGAPPFDGPDRPDNLLEME